MNINKTLNHIIDNGLCIQIKNFGSASATKEALYVFLSHLAFEDSKKIEITTALLELISLDYANVKIYLENNDMLVNAKLKKQDIYRLRSLFDKIHILDDNAVKDVFIEIKIPKKISEHDDKIKEIINVLESGLDYKTYLLNIAKEQELKLQHQSKLASLGEMIGNIAHQWRQPLNQISALKDSIVEDYRFNELTDERMDEFNKKIDEVLLYMSKTIDDFRNFFTPTKEKIVFDINESIRSATGIVSSSLSNNNVKLTTKTNKKNITVSGCPTEFAQVVINLINNARDAVVNNKIKDAKIDIETDMIDDKAIISVSDNGGGIPEKIMTKIFEPYFTTKFASQGTGLGLYMSKNIIEVNMGGHFNVRNVASGAQFTIELKIQE